MKKLSASYWILAAILLLSMAGAAIVIYTTANGPWGYTDPVVYISTARSLDRGEGLVYYEADAAFLLELARRGHAAALAERVVQELAVVDAVQP